MANTKNVKSHNFTKSILKSFLLWWLSEHGPYEINKFDELKDDTTYRIKTEEDINKFLTNDNNFYFNVKGTFTKGIKLPIANYSLMMKQKIESDNSSIQEIKRIEEYWNEHFENPYYHLMEKIYNTIIDCKEKTNKKLSKQISFQLLKEKHKKIILSFIGLNLFRAQLIQERLLAKKINISNFNEITDFFWIFNPSESILDNYDFLSKYLTSSTTESYIKSTIEIFGNYDIKIIKNIFGNTFLNPNFIHLFDDNVLIMPIAFKSLSIILIKKNHLIMCKNQKFSLFNLNRSTSIFNLFVVTKESSYEGIFQFFTNYLINTWISNYGFKIGDFYVIKDPLDKNFKDEFKITKQLILNLREEYYKEKAMKSTYKDVALIINKGKNQ